jgi:PAS domain S-box-containing protein
MFDWRALERWGLDEANLPLGSVVINRQLGFWALYKQYVLVAIVALLAQTIAILGLLWQRAKRRKTEVELRRSEERFSKSFRHSPLAISLTTANDDRYIEVNETFEQLTGWAQGEVAGRSPYDIDLWVDRNQRIAFVKQLLEKGHVQNLEVRLCRKDGQVRTMLGSSELIDVGGEPCALSVFADITERKNAEDALASVSRRLIDAQEQERTRIARELHDDINQRIAMLGIKLDVFQQSLPRQAAESQRRLNELRQLAAELGTEVQGISHRLHSSKLEYLGLVAACRSFCREVADVHKIDVNFTAENIPSALSQDVSLCLFRVLQESLSNAIKHSAAQHFEVQLRGTSSEIQLTVRDHGIGFDADEAIVSRGLGLISMRERVSVVNGMILIASKPMRGTEITVRVPVVEKGESKTISGAA